MNLPSPPPSRMVITGLILIGLSAASIGLGSAWSGLEERKTGVVVDGEVVDHNLITGKVSGYVPVTAFTYEGRVYRVQGHIASSSPKPPVGQAMKVLVNPTRPAESRVDSFAEQWLFPIVFGGAGILAVVGGVAMFVQRRRLIRRAAG